jgi:hypothetical protein
VHSGGSRDAARRLPVARSDRWDAARSLAAARREQWATVISRRLEAARQSGRRSELKQRKAELIADGHYQLS